MELYKYFRKSEHWMNWIIGDVFEMLCAMDAIYMAETL